MWAVTDRSVVTLANRTTCAASALRPGMKLYMPSSSHADALVVGLVFVKCDEEDTVEYVTLDREYHVLADQPILMDNRWVLPRTLQVPVPMRKKASLIMPLLQSQDRDAVVTFEADGRTLAAVGPQPRSFPFAHSYWSSPTAWEDLCRKLRPEHPVGRMQWSDMGVDADQHVALGLATRAR